MTGSGLNYDIKRTGLLFYQQPGISIFRIIPPYLGNPLPRAAFIFVRINTNTVVACFAVKNDGGETFGDQGCSEIFSIIKLTE